ncbi:MAG TPA: hypothetical protein DDW76_37120 [Cyanobacteria bacterium UBA11369]|nr:hypothetical protein [Cyanobacteria bacterium UBA11371]HBE33324.1 hypothetical protein [Cyanobacteria bacterium UBA11368]HBE54228.1 hypothetical protein [Cyanobacteria bacterium UBA11369]
MYVAQVSKQYTSLREIDINQTTQSSAQPSNSQLNKPIISDVVLTFSSVGFIAMIAAACLMASKIRIARPKPFGFKIKPSNQVPCKNCQYFSGNFYLKCAVHPNTVLTKEASNCADYSAVDEEPAE